MNSYPDEPILIAYFCRNCQKVVKGQSQGAKKKYSFSCPDCGNQCIYGTARAMIDFLRIKESSENGKILLSMQEEKVKGLTEKNATNES
ncbi:MAG: hypothetical protein Q8O95_05425 [bacterium]|nr:hypothetical protein [bacterium]